MNMEDQQVDRLIVGEYDHCAILRENNTSSFTKSKRSRYGLEMGSAKTPLLPFHWHLPVKDKFPPSSPHEPACDV